MALLATLTPTKSAPENPPVSSSYSNGADCWSSPLTKAGVVFKPKTGASGLFAAVGLGSKWSQRVLKLRGRRMAWFEQGAEASAPKRTVCLSDYETVSHTLNFVRRVRA